MKAIVLSSGGVDSTTCLALAIDRLGKENVAAVSIFYGQKHDKELQCARKIAAYYEVPHYELGGGGAINCHSVYVFKHKGFPNRPSDSWRRGVPKFRFHRCLAQQSQINHRTAGNS